MQTIFINWPHKLLIFAIFGLTYVLAIVLSINNNLNQVLIGDASRSLTFIWTVFILTLINLSFIGVSKIRQINHKIMKFLIRVNVEYGKIYTGLFLTAVIFLIQTTIVQQKTIVSYWQHDKYKLIISIILSLCLFIIFPAIAAFVNYYLVKYFRKLLWS